VHSADVGTFQNLRFADHKLPFDVNDSLQPPYVAAVEFLFVPQVGGLGLAAIEECAKYVGLVYTHPGVLCEAGITSNSLIQFGHHCACLGNTAVGNKVEGERAIDRGP
jgi:hypothetical protein